MFFSTSINDFWDNTYYERMNNHRKTLQKAAPLPLKGDGLNIINFVVNHILNFKLTYYRVKISNGKVFAIFLGVRSRQMRQP